MRDHAATLFGAADQRAICRPARGGVGAVGFGADGARGSVAAGGDGVGLLGLRQLDGLRPFGAVVFGWVEVVGGAQDEAEGDGYEPGENAGASVAALAIIRAWEGFAMNEPWVQITTLAIALLGAVLGMLNTWRTFRGDRVKLRMVPLYAEDTDGGHNFAVEVVNLSSFPVVVNYIGFSLQGTDKHMQLPAPAFIGGERLPVRLEARASCTALAPLAAFDKAQLARIDRAVVQTACGHEAKGDSTSFRQVIDLAAASL